MTRPNEQDILMTPGEVAKIFKVTSKTVTRWAKEGKISFITTPGKHKRFWKSEVRRFLQEKKATQ